MDVCYFFMMAFFLKMAEPGVQPKKSRGPFTRYFSFTRVNPSKSDCVLLSKTCVDINAYLCYRINKIDGRLEGFIVLNGPRTYVGNICRLFPNFLFTHLQPDAYMKLTEGDGFTVEGSHPFQSVSRRLFPEYRRRLFDGEEDDIVAVMDG